MNFVFQSKIEPYSLLRSGWCRVVTKKKRMWLTVLERHKHEEKKSKAKKKQKKNTIYCFTTAVSQVSGTNVTEGWPTQDGVTLRYHLSSVLSVCTHAELVTEAPRIRMLTSLLHSAHSFWNDSIYLILLGFRVCALRQCGILFQSRFLLRTFAYLNFVLKFGTGSAWRLHWKEGEEEEEELRGNASSTWRLYVSLMCRDSHLLFTPPHPLTPPYTHLLRNAKFPLDVDGTVCCSSSAA